MRALVVCRPPARFYFISREHMDHQSPEDLRSLGPQGSGTYLSLIIKTGEVGAPPFGIRRRLR